MGISTHLLDTTLGRPAKGVAVSLHLLEENGAPRQVAQGVTDGDGRIKPLLETIASTGTYRIVFHTGAYLGATAFFPTVQIDFRVGSVSENYHVPLLLNPFGYSTYRGS